MLTQEKKEIKKKLLKKVKEIEKEIWEYHETFLLANGYTKEDYIDELDNGLGGSDEWADIHYMLGLIDSIYNTFNTLKIK